MHLAPNVGLTGLGLSGQMSAGNGYFNAIGIPLTEQNDDGTVNHYQTAVVEVRDAGNNLLAETRTVAPLSTEMHCANCHFDGGIENISTGNYRMNILVLHDMHNGTNLTGGPIPVLCASCHPDNALGTTGTLPPLSHAMHMHHSAVIPTTLDGCYMCHPGANTRCLRGVMATKAGLSCPNCHGGMEQVGAEGRDYWLQEPDCGQCHMYAANLDALYRHSTGHGGVYCEACHGSTHAELPSSLAADNDQAIRLQGYAGALNECWICHTDGVTAENPHETSGGKMRAGLVAAH